MSYMIPEFTGVRALVVGDVMLDRYWHGSTGRISPEAPVPVVRIEQSDDRPGGAGNVALNMAALGVQTTVLGIVGDDAESRLLERGLEVAGVQPCLLRVSGVPTVTKLRVMSRHQQLIRLDFEDLNLSFDSDQLLAEFARLLVQTDVVILSDYGKGVLRHAPKMIALARRAGKPVLVDPKGRDFQRYRDATVITPNLSEFEAVVGEIADEADLAAKGSALVRELGLTRLLVTRGEQGMSLFSADGSTTHLPARAREVFDVTGAGDTVISLLAAGVTAGLDWADAAALANLAAGIVVGKLGAATVTVPELRRVARQQTHGTHGVVDEEELLIHIADARRCGERLVMTNGCFDLLHPGHISYLEAARALGDRLIVAVNDDASVRRLKGASRPINPLVARMRMLAALSCVDWVAPFSEDTPERLICRVVPDVLVKGGDYRPEQIAGATCVQRAGGEVQVLAFQEGHSTTALVERIRQGLDAS